MHSNTGHAYDFFFSCLKLTHRFLEICVRQRAYFSCADNVSNTRIRVSRHHACENNTQYNALQSVFSTLIVSLIADAAKVTSYYTRIMQNKNYHVVLCKDLVITLILLCVRKLFGVVDSAAIFSFFLFVCLFVLIHLFINYQFLKQLVFSY